MQIKTSIVIPGDWTIPEQQNFVIRVNGWISNSNGVILPMIASIDWPGVSCFSIRPDCMIRVVELIEQILVDQYVDAKLNFADQFGNHD